MHVFARGVCGRPYADGVLGARVEIPDELAGLGVIGSDEAADAIFAAIRADQDLAVHGSRRHRLAVAKCGIGDLGLPDHAAGFGIERDQLGIERCQIDLVVINGHAAVVGAAAIGRDRTHGVLVVPILLARLGVERVDVVERRRDIHDAVDDDRRRLHGFLHFRLEDPGGVELANVGRVDLLAREIPGLIVIAVGLQEVVFVLSSGVELLLSYGRGRRPLGLSLRQGPPGEAQSQRANQRASHFPTHLLPPPKMLLALPPSPVQVRP